MERVLGYVEQATAMGARVAYGGRRVLESTGGWLVEPKILDNVTPDMPVAREEIFGPVVSILSFEHESEAVVGVRRPRQGPRGPRPVQRAQDHVVRAEQGLTVISAGAGYRLRECAR